MKVAFDSNFLTFLLVKASKPPMNPETGELVTHPTERILYLVNQIEKSRSKIVIPTPVLSEVLVQLGDKGPRMVQRLDRNSNFEIVPFDVKAAIELAQINNTLGKKYDRNETTWAKVKFDRQIVAICKICDVDTIYSDDGHVCTLAESLGMNTKRVYDLELPEGDAQGDLLNY
jgi:predicted nucleic acid-binding protein